MYSYMIGSICVSRTVPKHSMRVSSCYSWYMYVGCMMCVVVCPTPCQATKPNVHRSAAKPASPNVYKQAPACIRSGSRTPYWMPSAWGALEPKRTQAGACLYMYGLSDSFLNAFSLGSPRARTCTGRRLLVCVRAIGLRFESLQPGEPAARTYKSRRLLVYVRSRITF